MKYTPVSYLCSKEASGVKYTYVIKKAFADLVTCVASNISVPDFVDIIITVVLFNSEVDDISPACGKIL